MSKPHFHFIGICGTAMGSVADVNAALADVSFTPAANYDQNTTISVSIDDVASSRIKISGFFPNHIWHGMCTGATASGSFFKAMPFGMAVYRSFFQQ